MIDTQTADLMKWLLVGAVSGYVPMGVFILYLVRELLKAKDTTTVVVREMTIYNNAHNSLLDRLSRAVDKLVELLK